MDHPPLPPRDEPPSGPSPSPPQAWEPPPYAWEDAPAHVRALGLLQLYWLPAVILLAVLAPPIYFFWPERDADAARTEDPVRIAPSASEEASARPGRAAEARASLSISSTPAGAPVYINFDSVGVTPLYLRSLRPGVHLVTLQSAGGVPVDSLIELEPDGFATLHVPLDAVDGTDERSLPAPRMVDARRPAADDQPTRRRPPPSTAASPDGAEEPGQILVTATPHTAEVFLDDVAQGTSPLLLRDVEPGLHVLTLRREGYADHVQSVMVRAGGAAEVNYTFPSQDGLLSVQVRPSGSIYLDGVLYRQNATDVFRRRLAVGTYELTVRHPTLGEVSERIYVGADEPLELTYDLSGGGSGSGGADAEQASVDAAPAAASPPAAEATPEVDGRRDADGAYLIADTAPQLVGGIEELHRRARYPETARRRGVEGRIYVRALVAADGRVERATVVRPLDPACDAEALRVVQSARFRPGLVDGAAVPVWHTVYLDFRIPD